MGAATSKRAGLWISAPVHSGFLADAERINRRILSAFAALTADDFSRRTHFLGGRFENLYLEPDRLPEARNHPPPGGALGAGNPGPGRRALTLRILDQRPRARSNHLRAHP